MKKTILSLSAAALLLASCGSKKTETTKVDALANDIDSISYAMGIMFGESVNGFTQEVDTLNLKVLEAAYKQIVHQDGTPLMDGKQAQNVYRSFLQNQQRKQFEVNIEEGKAFMDEFEKEEGVIATDSGIRFKYLKKGNGASPSMNDKVRCSYVGKFTDGQQFDGSEKPVTFGVAQVIPGWTELLLQMKEGDKIKAAIPYDMAYGEQGNRGIPPYSTLVFEFTLVEVLK